MSDLSAFGSTDSGDAWDSVLAIPGRLKDWLLLEVNRYLLAFGILCVGFALFLWLELDGILVIERDATSMLYLFSALAGGNITLITIVISINQLILSRELRSPRELQTEMHAAAEFRNKVEAETDRVVVPEEPAEFLRILIKDTQKQIDRLTQEVSDPAVQSDLGQLQETLQVEFDETTRRLDASHEGVFPALLTILNADFATHLNHTRWLKRTHADLMSDSTTESLKGLEDHLDQLDIARQYFKTVYIKQELADVSNLVMSTGLAAVLVAIVFIVFTGNFTTLGSGWGEFLLVPLAVSLNLLPLALLISHVFRIATVARRTAAITPFLAPTE